MREAERLRKIEFRSVEEAAAKVRREKERRRLVDLASRGSYAELLQQAGLFVPVTAWLGGTAALGGLLSYIVWHMVGGLVGAAVGPLFIYHFAVSYLLARAEKRRRNVVPHLPAFIDVLEASLGTGYTMEAAVEHAADALPQGVLRDEFSKVVQMLRTHVTLDEALNHVLRAISGQEVVSLVITLRLFSGIGGRVAAPLHRLGSKMREQQAVLERASRDLVGTKQAFYVIFGLSVAAPLLLFVAEPDYIASAFRHPLIRFVMQGALVVQLVCIMFFKSLTSLRT